MMKPLLLFLTFLLPIHATHNTAMQLLRPNDKRNRTSLCVVESTLAYLEGLQGPVAVVAITGPYHTGKSFLLNQVARSIGGRPEDQEEVFRIGKDVNPETSGVWMYHRALTLPGEDAAGNHNGSIPARHVDVLFLDTEGFSVSNVTEAYDAKVFAASTLLSSLLIYNSMHNLHAGELEYLDLLLHNTQLFSIKTALKQEEELKEGGGGSRRFPFLPFFRSGGDESSGTAALTELFRLPPLLMSVQAFTMQFAKEDADCTAWLTRLLSAPVRSSMGGRQTLSEDEEATPTTNELQHMGIGTLFPSVSCQTLFLPATSREQLNNLADVPLASMTPDFLRDLAAMDAAILSHLEPKRWRGGSEPLSGAALASLVRLVVDALSSGDLSDIPGRWELYEGHLRASSVRAALGGFDHEVTRLKAHTLALAAAQQQEEGHARTTTVSRPLTQHELSAVLKAADAYAQALCEKLLVGLTKSYHLASKEVGKGVATAKAAAKADHTQAVQAFLRDAADDVLEMEMDAMHEVVQFPRGGKAGSTGKDQEDKSKSIIPNGLPMPHKALESWIAAQEKDATTRYQSTTRLFKDEATMYAAAGKELRERLTAAGNTLRLQNKEALEAFLEEKRFEALAQYKRELDNKIKAPSAEGASLSLPPHVHPPDCLQLFHAEAHARMLARFAEATQAFQGEKDHDLHVTKIKAEAAAVLAAAHKANSQKLRAFCEGVKEELVRGVAVAVGRLAEVFDEDKLEEGLRQATAAREEEYTRRVGPSVRKTEEGRAVAQLLSEELAGIQEGARKGLADKLRRVLEEPLIDVCKKIIVARCDALSYSSVSRFRKDVHKECGGWARKHEIGKKLSKRMLAHVLDQFIESELRPCRDAIAKEERRLRFWRKVTWGVGGALALFAYLRYKDLGPGGGGGYLQRPGERGRREQGARPPPINPWAAR